MSVFTGTYTFAKNGTSANPTITELPCAAGVIHRIRIRFPPGSRALLNIALFQGSTPIAPSNVGMTFQGDSEIIEFDEFYEFVEKPYAINVVGWNTDTVLSHLVIIQVGVLPKWALLPIAVTEGIMSTIKYFLQSSISSRKAVKE